MIYPVIRVEMRHWDVAAFIHHEADLIRGSLQNWPFVVKTYKRSMHWLHILYMAGVGMGLYSVYPWAAAVMAILLVVGPLFGEHE